MRPEIHITGAGLLWAGGEGLDSLAGAVRNSKSHIAELKRMKAEDGSSLFGAELCEDALERSVPEGEYRGVDRFGRLNIAGVLATVRDAGFARDSLSGGALENTGLVLSTTFGPWDSINRFVRTLIEEGPMATSARVFPNTVPNSAQGRVAMALGMKGVSTTLTGVPALTYAFDLLRRGRAEQIVAGGADELNANLLSAFSDDGTLATQDAAAACPRPFETDRISAAAGEGFAAFFCETERAARRRGVRSLGRVLGYGIASDGRIADSFAGADPEGRAFEQAMRRALAHAGVEAGAVDAVIAAANGCPRLDAGEARALAAVFGTRVPRFPIKQSIGECFGASSAIALAAALTLLGGDMGCVMVNAVDLGGNCTSFVLAQPTSMNGGSA